MELLLFLLLLFLLLPLAASVECARQLAARAPPSSAGCIFSAAATKERIWWGKGPFRNKIQGKESKDHQGHLDLGLGPGLP